MNKNFNRNDAVVLAATRGTRMGRISKYLPKCLLPINGIPLIVRQLLVLEICNVNRAQICLESRMGPMIEKSIKNGYTGSIKLEFSYENNLRGTGWTTFLQKKKIHHDFIMVMADEFLTSNNFIRQIHNTSGQIVLGVCHQSIPSQIMSGCNVRIDENSKRLLSLKEKPKLEELFGDMIWTGYARFPIWIFDKIDQLSNSLKNDTIELTDVLVHCLSIGIDINYIIEDGINININTWEDYQKAIIIQKETKDPF